MVLGWFRNIKRNTNNIKYSQAFNSSYRKLLEDSQTSRNKKVKIDV
jgi:hypothetical protein